MLPILNIHEAVPGHYVQLVYANRSPSLIKSIFGNGAMIEGWAVYAERMMLESGYGEHTAPSWLVYSKWNLRCVCNTVLDYAVHVLDMTEAEAIDLLTRRRSRPKPRQPTNGGACSSRACSSRATSAGYTAILDLREQLETGARGRVRFEALPRAVLELRQRAGASDSRADARRRLKPGRDLGGDAINRCRTVQHPEHDFVLADSLPETVAH